MSRKKSQRRKIPTPGTSFGQSIQGDWSTGDQIGHEVPSRPSPPEHLLKLTEQQQIEIENFPAALTHLVGGISTLLENEACRLIFTAAINDVMHLVERGYRLDGRSAAYSARSLFEHVINFLDVTKSPVNNSERYTDHRYITQQQIANHREALALLSSKERKEEAKQLNRLASRVAPQVKKAIEDYGTSFKRQWAEGSLYDRAKAHDMEDGYAGYRILSSVIHGSSGSLAGITRVIDDVEVHRTGPDLELASLAWIEGLSAFLNLADQLVSITGTWEAKQLQGRTENLIFFWPKVREELRRIDKQFWPKEPPIGFLAVVAFYPGGRRWYQYDTLAGTAIRAEPPAQEPDLSQLQERYKSYHSEDFGGRPMTAIVEGISVQPVANQESFPASSIMPPSGYPAKSMEPRTL